VIHKLTICQIDAEDDSLKAFYWQRLLNHFFRSLIQTETK